MLMDLGIGNRSVYEEEFEKEFLLQSAEFYSIESQRGENSASVYFRKVESRMKEEASLASNCLVSQLEINFWDDPGYGLQI